MAGEQENWPVEEIPDHADLYKRIHKNIVRDGKIIPFAFRDYEMSVDWDKYSTPEETRQKGPQEAAKYGIVAMHAGDARNIHGQVVVHTPSRLNRAHSDVKGEKDEEARVKLRRICIWIIPL
jgi:hypothetical protein